ncbi:MAG: hypothetical protein CHACPFDD_03885 [Phycisphaerae bacterium]|nr:hypothetical protein [Phycisphaerae bacterium]
MARTRKSSGQSNTPGQEAPRTIPFTPAARADAERHWTCYATADFHEAGVCAILVLRRVPGERRHVVLGFLVDLWCVGLKQAFGRLGVSVREFERDYVGAQAMAGHEMQRIDLETAQRLVARGIRFALQNGFNLPPRYECWTALLEVDDDDEAAADLSEFGLDGKLRFVGSREDLQARLQDGDVRAFLARPDVEFEEVACEVDEGDADFEWMCEQMRVAGLGAVRQWCFANGRAPHPQLAEAWDVMLEAMFQMNDVPGEIEHLDASESNDFNHNVHTFLDLEQADHSAGLREALKQIVEFTSRFENVAEMMAAIHFDADDGEGARRGGPRRRGRKDRAVRKTSRNKPPA